MSERAFGVDLLHESEMESGMEFVVSFGDRQEPVLLVDEMPPLGEGNGPDAASVLAAAVGQCMSSSLLFCLRKSRVPVKELRTRVEGRVERNAEGRLRIAGLKVRLEPRIDGDVERLSRCAGMFEKFCTVAESIRPGIEIEAEVVLPSPSATAAPAGDRAPDSAHALGHAEGADMRAGIVQRGA